MKQIDKYNNNDTLIFLDWDDTLFPSSWVIQNNIDLINSFNKSKYIPLFKDLDKTIYNFLKNLQKYAKIIIITNALLSWIQYSLDVLPKTSQIITSIRIISARQLFQNKYSDIMEWKKQTFKYVINKENNKGKIMNIISIGDAEYEYKALIDLYKSYKEKKKLLKSIKLINNPTHHMLIDQLNVLNKAVPDID